MRAKKIAANQDREITIWCSKLRHDWNHFQEFTQEAANRLAQGYPTYEAPYGGPHAINKYMSRLEKELQAYRRTGNREHLINIQNYAYLESRAPENPRFHYDNTVMSATRKPEKRGWAGFEGW